MSNNVGKLISGDESEKLSNLTRYKLAGVQDSSSNTPHLELQNVDNPTANPDRAEFPYVEPELDYTGTPSPGGTGTLKLHQRYNQKRYHNPYGALGITIPADFRPLKFSRSPSTPNTLDLIFLDYSRAHGEYDQPAFQKAFSIDGITTPGQVQWIHNYDTPIVTFDSTIYYGRVPADTQFHTIIDMWSALGESDVGGYGVILDTYKFEIAVKVNLPTGFEGHVTAVLSEYPDDEHRAYTGPQYYNYPELPLKSNYTAYDTRYVKDMDDIGCVVLHLSGRFNNIWRGYRRNPSGGSDAGIVTFSNRRPSLNIAINPTNGVTYSNDFGCNPYGEVRLVEKHQEVR